MYGFLFQRGNQQKIGTESSARRKTHDLRIEALNKTRTKISVRSRNKNYASMSSAVQRVEVLSSLTLFIIADV